MATQDAPPRAPLPDVARSSQSQGSSNDNSDSEKEGAVATDSREDAESACGSFIESHATPSQLLSPLEAQLAHPVVIPQRRPGKKERGFVEAYAPALDVYGIEQDAFVDFLRLMNKAVRQNKVLTAIQVAAAGTAFAQNTIAMGVGTAVQFVAGAIAHAEANWRTNSFLDRINKEYFRPRGLFCLLMAYNPIALDKTSQEKKDDAISRSMASTSSSSGPNKLLARAKRNLRNPVAATAEGEGNLPRETAELVYLDDPVIKKGDQTAKGVQGISQRMNNYLDHRAQARYAKESKGDILSNPNPVEFKNRYLDPNSAASNGGLLGLISGGRLTYDPEKSMQTMKSQYAAQGQLLQQQQEAMMGSFQEQFQSMGLSVEQQQTYMKQYQEAYHLQLQQIQQQTEMMEKVQPQRRILRNILYLMIVDIPPEAEMATARNNLHQDGTLHPSEEIRYESVEV